jgi:septal ring factor EnvC (AmiA/AmiB activator)
MHLPPEEAPRDIVKLQTIIENHERLARERRLLVAKLQVELEKKDGDNFAELHRDFRAAQGKIKELQAHLADQSAQAEAALLEERGTCQNQAGTRKGTAHHHEQRIGTGGGTDGLYDHQGEAGQRPFVNSRLTE